MMIMSVYINTAEIIIVSVVFEESSRLLAEERRRLVTTSMSVTTAWNAHSMSQSESGHSRLSDYCPSVRTRPLPTVSRIY